MKRLNFIVLFAVVIFASGCFKDYRKVQFRHCLEDYAHNYSSCSGDDDCESLAKAIYRSCMGTGFVFPVHLVILTDQLKGSTSEIEQLMRNQVDTLNRYFTEEDSRYPPDNRRQIISFTYKSTTFYKWTQRIGGDLVDFASPDYDFDLRLDFKALFNDETNRRIKDPNAINIYIVDAQGTSNSHGQNNGNKSYILLDYARINGDAERAAVQEHEMGHCFLLDHECYSWAGRDSRTNIMATGLGYQDNGDCKWSGSDEARDTEKTCDGEGGKRNIGFNDCQTEVVLDVAVDIFTALGL